MEEYADEVFDLLDNGAHIYFCGLKGMMPGAKHALHATWSPGGVLDRRAMCGFLATCQESKHAVFCRSWECSQGMRMTAFAVLFICLWSGAARGQHTVM